MLYLLVFLTLAYWWLAWPRVISLLFHSETAERLGGHLLVRARRAVGAFIFASAAALALGAWTILGLHERGFGDLQLQGVAIGTVAATTFVYAALIPPRVSVITQWVTDRDTGALDSRHRSELWLVPGAVTPVFIAFFNAGIATWSQYRITIGLPEGFVVATEDGEYPQAKQFPWGHGEVTRIDDHTVQVIRSAPLAAGEPQVARLFVRAPRVIPSGATMHVVVASDGRIGEGSTETPIVSAAEVPSLPQESTPQGV
jgi:hypothetical protein